MNITGKDRKGQMPASYFLSDFVVRSPAKSRDITERPYWFSKPYWSSVSSSFFKFLCRSDNTLLPATSHYVAGDICTCPTQDVSFSTPSMSIPTPQNGAFQ